MRVAIVYDRVNKWGGAERVLLALHNIFPDAPLYTSVYDEDSASWVEVFPKIHTSFLQNIPFARRWHEGFGWLMPLAFESFNFDQYELVISVTSEAAKGIITGTKTKHICYMLTPTRYLWSHFDYYFKNPILKFISRPVINYLRRWDKIAAQRPDEIIAISTVVKERIKKYYNRDSEIVFPPVTIRNGKKLLLRWPFAVPAYYLVVSRLVPYKRVDLVVNAFNKLGKKLVIVGVGSQANSLKRKAYSNIKFVGKITDEELSSYYSLAKALIMPQEEDFGMVAVEAQSFGVPVIAYKKGGAGDSVIDGKIGIFFDKQKVESLIAAVEKFEKTRFVVDNLYTNAEKFSEKVFKRKILDLINK